MSMTVRMNIYHDGEHYLGKLCQPRIKIWSEPKGMQDPHKKQMRTAFRAAYDEADAKKLKKEDRKAYIQERFPELLEADGSDAGCDVFAMYNDEEYEAFEKDTVHMLYLRKKRFQRKANLNEWNYFVTITYDDGKMTAEEFAPAVRKALSDHSTRFDWNYCAVFEDGEQGGRKHLHALAYIPEGQEHGEFFLRRQWSEKRKRNEFCNDHSYFHEKFGNCDFRRIERADMNRMVRYLTKYMTKTNVKLIYSRGVPDEFKDIEIDEADILRTVRYSGGYVAVLFDSVMGMFFPEPEEVAEYLDYGELGDYRSRICNKVKAA